MLGLLGLLAGLAALLYAASRPAEAEEEEEPTVLPPEEIEVIDAEFKEGWVWWAALADWRPVYERWLNEWPADTDITFSWEIKNTGNVGAYFQVYLINPGSWRYLGPNETLQVTEESHTPPLPLVPGYQTYHINILARKITGERVGAVWTSDDIEVNYV